MDKFNLLPCYFVGPVEIAGVCLGRLCSDLVIGYLTRAASPRGLDITTTVGQPRSMGRRWLRWRVLTTPGSYPGVTSDIYLFPSVLQFVLPKHSWCSFITVTFLHWQISIYWAHLSGDYSCFQCKLSPWSLGVLLVRGRRLSMRGGTVHCSPRLPSTHQEIFRLSWSLISSEDVHLYQLTMRAPAILWIESPSLYRRYEDVQALRSPSMDKHLDVQVDHHTQVYSPKNSASKTAFWSLVGNLQSSFSDLLLLTHLAPSGSACI